MSTKPGTTALIWLGKARWIAALAAVALLLQGTAVSAQTEEEGMRVEGMSVSILPEYDDPSVLVMAQGDFAGDFTPQEVEFVLPLGAEVTQACGLTQPDQEHLCQPYILSQEGDSMILRYTLPLPTFFFEYYYDPVEDPAAPRNVEYLFQPTYPVDSLLVEVQEPLGAADFTLEPSSQQVFSDDQGFRYFYYDYEALTPDEPVSLDISYLKNDANTSVEPRAQTGAAGIPTEDDGGLNRVFLVVVSLGVIGLLAFLAFGRRAGQMATAAVSPGTAGGRKATTRAAAPASAPSGGGFCFECGHQLQTSHRFCPSCGTAARRPSGKQ